MTSTPAMVKANHFCPKLVQKLSVLFFCVLYYLPCCLAPLPKGLFLQIPACLISTYSFRYFFKYLFLAMLSLFNIIFHPISVHIFSIHYMIYIWYMNDCILHGISEVSIIFQSRIHWLLKVSGINIISYIPLASFNFLVDMTI